MSKPGLFTRLKLRWKEMLEEYGMVAFATWFAVFFSTIFAFAAAIDMGMSPADLLSSLGMDPARADSIGTAGKWGVAYGLTQLTKPARIAIVLVLTPFVARAYSRITGKPSALDRPLDGAEGAAPESAQEEG